MKKVLIADYFDSLITPESKEINQLYHMNFDCSDENAINAQNFAISKLNQDLEEFLHDGNELVIVTNLVHCTIDWFINHWIGKTLKLFTKYIRQIKVFLQDERLDENISQYVNKNNCFYIAEGEYIFQIIKRKSEVFKYLDLKNKLLFSIGDSANDIDMIAKNIQKGGISSLIDYSLLFDRESNDIATLMSYASQKSDLQKNIEEYKYYMKYGDIACDIERNEEYKNLQFQMVSEQYKKGLISIDDIRKKTRIYEVFSMYYFNSYYFNCSIQEQMFDIEKIDQSYNSCLLIDSSFNEFNQKFIKRIHKKIY